MEKLNLKEIKENLKKLRGWNLVKNKLEKDFSFKDFASTIGFVNYVAGIAEKLDHHPDISIYDWNNCRISISTHSVKGLTKKDFELASDINRLLKEK